MLAGWLVISCIYRFLASCLARDGVSVGVSLHGKGEGEDQGKVMPKGYG